MQYIPVVLELSQSADPHLQLPPLFSDLPSVLLHGATGREQLLDAAMQTIPVPFPSPLLVHALLPQMQGVLSALLGLDPSVILQACAFMPEAQSGAGLRTPPTVPGVSSPSHFAPSPDTF